MKAKDKTVNFRGVHPELLHAMIVVDLILRKEMGYELIITSCRDGKHSETSRHYIGCAFDFRTWISETDGTQLPMEKKQKLVDLLSKELPEFYFLAESTHIHCGYKIRYNASQA